MQTTRSAWPLALAATVLLLATITAGCARRTPSAGDGPATGPTATVASDATPASTVPGSAATAAPTPTPAATPVPTPDLSAVDALLKDIDNDLNADASAGTNEGTAP